MPLQLQQQTLIWGCERAPAAVRHTSKVAKVMVYDNDASLII